MAWLAVVLAGTFVALAVLHGARLALGGAPAEAAHGAMALGMAAMFAPHDPVPPPAWLVLFGVIAAATAVAATRGGDLGGEPGHVLVGCVAMMFMSAAGHPAPAWASPVAIGLAGACGWHAVRCVQRLEVASGPRSLLGPRIGAGSHAAMAAGMSVMLLAAI